MHWRWLFLLWVTPSNRRLKQSGDCPDWISAYLLGLLSFYVYYPAPLFSQYALLQSCFRGQYGVPEECHFHHPLLRAFWMCFSTWLMALSALLWLYQEKALIVVVRPNLSGITGEAVKTAVRSCNAKNWNPSLSIHSQSSFNLQYPQSGRTNWNRTTQNNNYNDFWLTSWKQPGQCFLVHWICNNLHSIIPGKPFFSQLHFC